MTAELYTLSKGTLEALSIPKGPQTIHSLFPKRPFAVYTVLRTFKKNHFLFLKEHCERLEQSISLMGWQVQFNREQLYTSLDSLCMSFPSENNIVRIDALEDGSLTIGLFPLILPPKDYYLNGVDVQCTKTLLRSEPIIKKTEYIHRRMQFLKTQESSIYEYLLLNDTGTILEGSSSNFYAVKNGEVWTSGTDILEGITRRALLTILKEKNVKVHFEGLKESEIESIDEACISSSSRAVLPIRSINNKIISDGKPGPFVSKLLEDYKQFADKYCYRATTLMSHHSDIQ